MNKICILVYLLVVVDIIETNPQEPTSYKAFAVLGKQVETPVVTTKSFDGFPPLCSDQRICIRVWYFSVCWTEEICTT